MPSSNALEDLVKLSSQRWLAALLADLAAHGGARFAELLHRLDLPRDSLVRTLATAQGLGWVIRNPGHGHPLRPEYLLTDAGNGAALCAANITAAHGALGLQTGSLTRWGLPLIAGIARGHDRFNALARQLPRASPRALSQGLATLNDRALIDRSLIDGRPPTSRYALTRQGQLLAAACSV